MGGLAAHGAGRNLSRTALLERFHGTAGRPDRNRIEDGNFPNATPDFKTFPDWDTSKANDSDGQLAGVDQLWTRITSHPERGPLWTEAKRVADKYNPIAAYKNTAIEAGGFDFSDASEACHIFGMGKPLINDHVDFFTLFVP